MQKIKCTHSYSTIEANYTRPQLVNGRGMIVTEVRKVWVKELIAGHRKKVLIHDPFLIIERWLFNEKNVYNNW